MAPPGQSGSQPLPPKEQALFKKIVKCYEHKQYRNGLRSAKQILSNAKYADHGETLAMKGLIMNCMGRKEEALDHVRRGLTKDLKSHVCWHVFGLVQRSEKKYDEAIKAYRNALKLDKDNMQILRDLSLLQIQMRDLEGYRDTRYTLLTLRPQQKASWVGYAMAYHLLKDYDMALRILEEFRKSNSPTGFDYEHSELLLYQNMVLREADRAQDAMDHLKKHEKEIFDVVAKAEIRERAAYIFDARKMKIEMKMKVTSAELLIKESRVPEATQIYKDLIDRNPECMDYYKSYERCLDLIQPDSRNKRSELYTEFCAAYPRASAPKRIALSFASGQEFEDALFKFLTAGFRKGLPALFQQVKSLYQKDEQREAIGQVVLRTKDSLENDGRIPGDDPKGARESPTTLLWVYYYLAQHFDLLKDPEQAMSYINKALDHTPTLIELLCVKAKILKHGGNASEAVKCMEEAQSLDTADRFINSKCAKYMLRAGLIPEAEAMCAKFTREGVNPVQNLNEMQCMWFEIECAKAHLRLGNIGEALKKCHEVDRHFLDITEDQFDFHTYCVRKMTLCAYVKLLRLEDGLRNHRFYIRAATIAIEIYLQLHDSPGGSRVNGVEGEGMSESEKRKQQRKKKKAEAKGQKDTPKENSGGGGKGKEKGDDVEAVAHEPLNPESLLNTSDPMEEAVKFLSPLIQLNSREIKIYTLGFEVYFRRKKVLPMLQCLMRAHQLDPIDPDYHLCRVKFLKFLEGRKYEGPVSEIISHSLPTLYGDKLPSPEDCNTVFEKSHENSLPHRIAACEAWQFLEKNTSNLVEKATSLSDSLSGRTWETCQQTLAKLRRGAFGTVAEKLAENYRAECEQLFPGANCFQLPESKQPIINNNGGTTSPVGNHHIENSHSDQDELAKKTANLKI